MFSAIETPFDPIPFAKFFLIGWSRRTYMAHQFSFHDNLIAWHFIYALLAGLKLILTPPHGFIRCPQWRHNSQSLPSIKILPVRLLVEYWA